MAILRTLIKDYQKKCVFNFDICIESESFGHPVCVASEKAILLVTNLSEQKKSKKQQFGVWGLVYGIAQHRSYMQPICQLIPAGHQHIEEIENFKPARQNRAVAEGPMVRHYVDSQGVARVQGASGLKSSQSYTPAWLWLNHWPNKYSSNLVIIRIPSLIMNSCG